MIADAPKFMDLFEKVRLEHSMNNIYLQSRVLNFKSVSAYMLNDCFQTREVVGSDVDTAALQLNIYTSVVYAFLVIAGIFVIVAFFGCCGAWKVTLTRAHIDLFQLLWSSSVLRPCGGVT